MANDNTSMDWLPWIAAAIVGAVVLPSLRKNSKRNRALAKARAAKKRKARTGRPRKGGRKLTKAELRAVRLRNLAKARRARRKK